MDKSKIYRIAQNAKLALEGDNSASRRRALVQAVEATREHWDVWQEVFHDRPELLEEMRSMLKERSGVRNLNG